MIGYDIKNLGINIIYFGLYNINKKELLKLILLLKLQVAHISLIQKQVIILK